jgi:hypothetical protein
VRSSQPHRGREACLDYNIQDCKKTQCDILLRPNKDLESQIFVDISQEGVNHGKICVV